MTPAAYPVRYRISSFGYVEEEEFSYRTELSLYRIFDELDALVLEHLPASLSIEPAVLIQHLMLKKHDVFLSRAAIIRAYMRYTERERILAEEQQSDARFREGAA